MSRAYRPLDLKFPNENYPLFSLKASAWSSMYSNQNLSDFSVVYFRLEIRWGQLNLLIIQRLAENVESWPILLFKVLSKVCYIPLLDLR